MSTVTEPRNKLLTGVRPNPGNPGGKMGIPVRLNMRQEEFCKLEDEAEKRGIEVEDLIVVQLRLYGVADVGDFLMPNEQRHIVTKALGKELTVSNVGPRVRRLAELSVAGLVIALPANLLERLKTRCIGKQEFHPWLQKTIVTELERFVGLR